MYRKQINWQSFLKYGLCFRDLFCINKHKNLYNTTGKRTIPKSRIGPLNKEIIHLLIWDCYLDQKNLCEDITVVSGGLWKAFFQIVDVLYSEWLIDRKQAESSIMHVFLCSYGECMLLPREKALHCSECIIKVLVSARSFMFMQLIRYSPTGDHDHWRPNA